MDFGAARVGYSSFHLGKNLLKQIACLASVYFWITGLHEFNRIEVVAPSTILRRLQALNQN